MVPHKRLAVIVESEYVENCLLVLFQDVVDLFREQLIISELLDAGLRWQVAQDCLAQDEVECFYLLVVRVLVWAQSEQDLKELFPAEQLLRLFSISQELTASRRYLGGFMELLGDDLLRQLFRFASAEKESNQTGEIDASWLHRLRHSAPVGVEDGIKVLLVVVFTLLHRSCTNSVR